MTLLTRNISRRTALGTWAAGLSFAPSLSQRKRRALALIGDRYMSITTRTRAS